MSNTPSLDQIDITSPLDENRDDYLLMEAIRESIYNPPEYVP